MDHVAMDQPQPDQPPGGRWQRLGIKYLLLLPLGLIAMLAMAAGILDTAIGHRLLVDVLAGTELDNGMRVQIGRIDGSIYGRMTLHDIVVRDAQGVVATSDNADAAAVPAHA